MRAARKGEMLFFKYVLKRVLLAIVAVFVLASVTFFLTRAAPGDPFTKTKEIPEATMANLKAMYGLDRPIYVQYAIQMQKIFLHGDFGTSFRTVGRDVNTIIKEQFPVSAQLGLFAVAVGTMFGLCLGVIASLYRNSAIDRFAMLLCVLGLALPGFLFSYLFQYFFAVLPVTDFGFSAENWLPSVGWGTWRHFILPGLALSLGVTATITRMTRSQMVDVQFSDYVKTAKAKGVSTWRLIIIHELRNAVLPILTILGPLLVGTMMGALITENIFGIPGLGRVILNSVVNSDYNVIMGVTIFEGSFLVLVILVTDILYGIIDPRIRVSH
jgi:ABC-type dipeptide/oligopeptide/nickel transport system permease component